MTATLHNLHMAFLTAIARNSHPTLTEAARTLGVSREHLSRVLHGHRVSARLLRRFSALTHPTPTHRP